MPDPNLLPLITFSTPRTRAPQPYQEMFLAAGVSMADAVAIAELAERYALTFGGNGSEVVDWLLGCQSETAMQNAMGKLAMLPATPPAMFERGPTIGRKRRARRARGRRRGNA
jgi:hypothetical protein